MVELMEDWSMFQGLLAAFCIAASIVFCGVVVFFVRKFRRSKFKSPGSLMI
jgi:hypothetical protein